MCAVARLLQKTDIAEVWGYGMAGGGVREAETLHGALCGAEVLILPLPASRDGIHPTAAAGVDPPTFGEIFSRAEDECLILGGMLSPAVIAAAGESDLEIADYYSGEELLRKNAAATAEAAVAMAAIELPVTLCGTTVAVIGSGRIAFQLLSRLRAWGARVLLYARSSDARRRAEADGAVVFPLKEGETPVFPPNVRAVFCTVPAMLFPHGCPLPPRGTPFYDLGGGAIDPAWAGEGGIPLPPSAGLPGRYSPESAGGYLFSEIRKLIRMRRGVDI